MSTTIEHRSLGDNLIESIKGVLIGIVMFIGAFPILYMNEGCTDMSEVAKTAIVVKADSPGSSGEGKLVSATADLKVDEAVGDPEMLAPGQYVKLHRRAEMYAWHEKKTKTEKKKLGGGTDIITNYSYEMVWTETPESSDGFHDKGYDNPSLSVHPADFYASKAKVGAFSFSPKDCELPSATDVALTAAMVKVPISSEPAPAATSATPAPTAAPKGKAAPAPKGKPGASAAASAAPTAAPAPAAPSGHSAFKLVGGYLFKGRGAPDQGKLGDVRVSFQAVTPGKQVTLYGKRAGNEVVAFVNDKGDKLFRAVPGTHEQAIAQLHGEHVMQTWIVRILGFICMWAGLGLILGPINAVLDIVPFVGSAGRFVTSIAMFPVALVLSGVTILVSIVAHSPILLALVGVVFVGALVAVIMVKRNKAPAPQAVPAGGMPPTGYQGPPQGGYGPPPGEGPPPGGGYGPPPGGGSGPPPGGGYGPPPGGGYGPPPGVG
jgi:hypothetical protein